MDNNIIVKLENVFKSYKDKEVIKGISLEINKGEIIGFLGENGSGKTTTIRMITGRTTATSGNISIYGVDPIKDYKKIADKIAVVSDEKSLYEDVSVKNNLTFFSKLYNCTSKDIDNAVKVFELEDVMNKNVGKLSTGYKQRVVLARAIIHNPDILFLDEPTLGLDPTISKKIRQKIKELNRLGKTVFLTTHYLDEAEELCDRVVILKDKKIIPPVSIKDIKKEYSSLENYYMKVYGE